MEYTTLTIEEQAKILDDTIKELETSYFKAELYKKNLEYKLLQTEDAKITSNLDMLIAEETVKLSELKKEIDNCVIIKATK